MSTPTLSRCANEPGYLLTIANGDKLLFCGVANPAANASEFYVANELRQEQVGTTIKMYGSPARVVAHGGTAHVRLNPGGGYSVDHAERNVVR